MRAGAAPEAFSEAYPEAFPESGHSAHHREWWGDWPILLARGVDASPGALSPDGCPWHLHHRAES